MIMLIAFANGNHIANTDASGFECTNAFFFVLVSLFLRGFSGKVKQQ